MWLLFLLLVAAPATAQEIPACTPAREGATACLSGKLCACRFQRGGSMTGRPDGHRWDCGVLRPACGEALNPPATMAPPQPLPYDLLLTPPFIGGGPGGPGPRRPGEDPPRGPRW